MSARLASGHDEPLRVATHASARAWTGVLFDELSARFAVLAEDMRQQSGTDVLLKSMLVTDAEVDALLARSQRPDALQFAPGSLMQLLLAEAAESSQHLRALQSRFVLNGFEMDCLLVCLAAEVVPRFERVFAYLNDTVAAKLPDADTLMRTVAPGQLPLQVLLGDDGRLQRYRLLIAAEGARFGPYRVAEGVVRYALGQGGFDPLLSRAWADADVPPLATAMWDTRPEGASVERLLRAQLEDDAPARTPLVFGLRGRAGSGRQYLVESACRRLGIGCIALNACKLNVTETLPPTLTAALRDSALLQAPVLLHHADAWLDNPRQLAEIRTHLQALVRELGSVLILAGEADLDLARWFPAARVVEIDLPPLTEQERSAAWRLTLTAIPGMPAAQLAGLSGELAAKFRLTHGEIALAAQRAVNSEPEARDDLDWPVLLHRCAAAVAAPRLAQLAQPMTVRHALEDLVLPPERMAALHEVVRRVRHRSRVLQQWGLEAVSSGGRGLVALFHGASGTGKTMAAEAIAGALRMRLFRIDLAAVVSKYIGETEKNLRAIFEEADRADAVLLFDEADALFGRRSAVKDAHDRYANIEINYLLQRIEQFEGIAILTTNMRTHIDEAFLRRIHIMVEFPLPGKAERLGLWDRSFPPAAPVADDIDWEFMAQRFELTGGVIRNAALGAAFLAADGAGIIGMPEVVNALRTELVKAGKRVADAEFGPYARYLSVLAAPPRQARRRHGGLPS